MKLKVDRKNDALYLRLDEDAIIESEEVISGVILDFDKEKKVVGIEILDISKKVNPDRLKVLQYETT